MSGRSPTSSLVGLACRLVACLMLVGAVVGASAQTVARITPAVSAQPDGTSPSGAFAPEIKRLLETQLAAGATEQRAQDLAALQGLYRDTGWRPLWSDASGADARAREMIATLSAAGSHGLDPEDYGSSAIAALMGATRPDLSAEFEVRLSLGVMAYASDLSRGRTLPGEVFAENHLTPSPIRRLAILKQLRARPAGQTAGHLEALAPADPAYDRLREALATLRAAAAAGLDWPKVDEGETLDAQADVEVEGARIAQLRARLLASGDLTSERDAAVETPALAGVFDPSLTAAVRRFQARHGLEVDGRVGPNTLRSLNVSLAARVRQAQINLERWRWMPDDLGADHLLVNLADFSVEGTFDGEPLYWSRAVVGAPYHRTPVFSDRIEYLEINPYWNVPHSIAIRELLPKIKEDPGYLAARNYEVLPSWSETATPLDPAQIDWSRVTAANFPYRLRQRPGPQNALGRIKFMFPNRFNVYLHDTPARSLFARASRAFSHGCVRLDKPLELADILLRDAPDWTPDRIRQTVASGRRTIVSLPDPVPVHITYLTAGADMDGKLQFREDVYDRDTALIDALFGPRAGSGEP